MSSPAESPDFYTGSPVSPADLWFRDPFIDQLWEKLRTEHVLLTAPRRTGKTSIMIHLFERPRAGYVVVHQNVQDFKHPAELFQAVIENFQEQHPQYFKEWITKGWGLVAGAFKKFTGRVQELDAGGFKVTLREADPEWHANWKQHAAQLLDQVRASGKPVLIIVDELPDMLLNMDGKEARDFMAWFRAQRESPPPNRDCLRWLLGGSINLAGTLDDLGGIDLINNLSREELPILTRDEVCQFVREMLIQRTVPFHKDVPLRVEALLGRPIPLFLQMVTQDLFRLWKKEQRELVATDVDAVFRSLIVSAAAQEKLQHYYSRINRYYRDPRRTAAYRLLSLLSQSRETGLTRRALKTEFEKTIDTSNLPKHQRDNEFNKLIRELENDFYVCEVQDDRFDFASGLMKAWWRKYYA